MSQTAAPPAPQFNTGDYVRIVDAEPGAPDPKSVVYYDYYRNLTGTVIKCYPDSTCAISINRKSLPEPMRLRHEASETNQRDKWLAGLSEEDRSKLSEKEKRFQLRYTILVAAKHVVPETPGSHSARSKPKTQEQPETAASDPPARPSLADLEAAETQYLNSKKSA